RAAPRLTAGQRTCSMIVLRRTVGKDADRRCTGGPGKTGPPRASGAPDQWRSAPDSSKTMASRYVPVATNPSRAQSGEALFFLAAWRGGRGENVQGDRPAFIRSVAGGGRRPGGGGLVCAGARRAAGEPGPGDRDGIAHPGDEFARRLR